MADEDVFAITGITPREQDMAVFIQSFSECDVGSNRSLPCLLSWRERGGTWRDGDTFIAGAAAVPVAVVAASAIPAPEDPAIVACAGYDAACDDYEDLANLEMDGPALDAAAERLSESVGAMVDAPVLTRQGAVTKLRVILDGNRMEDLDADMMCTVIEYLETRAA